jgi:hypothetical protein
MDTRRGSFLQPKGHVPTAVAVSLCMSVGRSVGQAGGWTGRSLGRSVLVDESEGRSARWAVGRWGGRAGRSVGVGRSVTRSGDGSVGWSLSLSELYDKVCGVRTCKLKLIGETYIHRYKPKSLDQGNDRQKILRTCFRSFFDGCVLLFMSWGGGKRREEQTPTGQALEGLSSMSVGRSGGWAVGQLLRRSRGGSRGTCCFWFSSSSCEAYLQPGA